ncbi:polycystin-2-like isoform X2 [Hydractinia symbiolongicarpus]|uniref:polycystin-2-like isoform X2 n=1 Tax=Hydractinia symbiolongicarpus TaxID=13093 RepID=UPI00254E7C6C|nr:polycystin-2-like isoform X2 [Hydractinia symbiolongicarpus]
MSAKRRNLQGSQTSLTRQDEMELQGRSRPESASSRKAWLDDHDGPGQDDVDFSPRQATVDLPSAMAAEPYSMQTKVTRDVRADGKAPPVDCFTRFLKTLRSLWKTRLTEDTGDDRELYVKTTLRELAIYIAFIVILCIMTFGMTNSTMYYFTKVMKDLFDGDDFKSITTMQGFWEYAEGGLVNGLYWEKYYNDEPVKSNERGYIYFENKILGRPRLRQVRVRNDSCVVHSDFKKEIKECYAPYSPSVEDKRSFGIMNGSAWTYATASELEGRSFWGRISTYEGGGFTQLLSPDKKGVTKGVIADLKKNLWLDRGTRAVFIDFSVYNANINLFCIITLVLEYPATGGCIPYSKFRTLKLLRYVTTMDYVVMACEGLFILFLLYYSIEEIIEIKKHKIEYFKDFWNIFDIVVILMGIICIVFNLYRTLEVDNLLKGLLSNDNQYANFEVLGYWQEQFNDFVAVAVFFAWIKVFKYISFNKTMTQLQSTLARCAKDIAGFAVMFFIIFLAYAQWGYLIFGTQVKDFSTYLDSVFTLFRIILGDFDFHAIEDANRILGPIFFITYVFFVFFVLINMFLAIINDTYAEVKSDLAQQESEFEIGDYFKKGYDKMMSKLSFKREKIVDIQKALQTADTNQDNKLDFEEWRAELKARGHADAEIEAVFAKYDLDGDRILNEVEQKKMQNDLEGQEAELNEEIEEVERAKSDADKMKSKMNVRDDDDDDSDDGSEGGGHHGIPSEEFTVLSRRVDRVEHSIGSIVSKIDAVLLKLEAMDKAKIKRRETMTKLLDSISEGGQGGDDNKREQMEKLVRDELERWDSDASLKQRSGSGHTRKTKGSSVSIKEDASLSK